MTLPTLEQLEQDPYAALGVRKFINATCHHTIMGGTLIPDTTLKAMRTAANDFVDLKELQKAAGVSSQKSPTPMTATSSPVAPPASWSPPPQSSPAPTKP